MFFFFILKPNPKDKANKKIEKQFIGYKHFKLIPNYPKWPISSTFLEWHDLHGVGPGKEHNPAPPWGPIPEISILVTGPEQPGAVHKTRPQEKP